MSSTRDLVRFPSVDSLRRIMKSFAALDAILAPEWEDRCFSYNARWAACEELGSFRNGSGDEVFALFNADGCWLKGFAHEAPMSPHRTKPPQVAKGMYEGVPDAFASCLCEPAFNVNDVTFSIWRTNADDAWKRGPVELPDKPADPDGSAALLSFFEGRPEIYQRYARDYFEVKVPLAIVRAVIAHEPLKRDSVESLNADADDGAVRKALDEIGYPEPRGHAIPRRK